jgi:PAS domain S-box-containing protein
MTAPLSVLHLEANPTDGALIQEILETNGIVTRVTRVETEAQFSRSLGDGCFDLILADHSLPSFDGLSALKIALEKCPDVPFIFVSGALGEEAAIEAVRSGATDYVLKERPARIVSSVQRALREAEERAKRRHAEGAARAAKARFEGILAIAPDAIVSVDSQQRIILFNQGAEKVFGYTHAEVVGRSLDLLLPRRFEEVHRRHLRDLARSPDVARAMGQRREVFGRRKDGSEFPAEASISKLDLGGELVFTVILRDVSERRRAEELLREAQADLAHVARVTTLGELVASIAHEINQPLAAIVADANAALNWLAGARPDLDRVRGTLEAIVRDGQRAGDVIQRIRQLTTKRAFQKVRLDLNSVIRDVVPLIGAELLRHRVSLHLALCPELRRVRGDRVDLQQVLINLVMNAIEAMASVEERPRELVIRSAPHEPGFVMVSVRDTGIGIDPNTVRALFGAFFTTKPGGMGMGLSISRSIVEGHGGRVWATSEEPQGAAFHFSLPVDSGAADGPSEVRS